MGMDVIYCFISDLKVVTFTAITFTLKLNYELLSGIFRKVQIYVRILR
jgi:hypothetical protein